MNLLRVRLFGSVELAFGDRMVGGFATRAATSLFAYLVLNHSRLVHRDVLCGILWGDRKDREARKALRTTLWRVRQVLEPFENRQQPFLRVERQHVGFAASERAWSDVWEFDDCLRAAGTRADQHNGAVADQLTLAASLYRGDLLEGCYDDWIASQRERLRLAFLDALERLVAYHRAREDWLEAVAWGRRLLRIDPLREQVHRTVMESHLARGDRPSALLQYQTCVQILNEELGIEPMEETRRLYEQIRTGDRAPAPVAGAPPTRLEIERFTSTVKAVVGELQQVLSRLETAQDGFSQRSSARVSGGSTGSLG